MFRKLILILFIPLLLLAAPLYSKGMEKYYVRHYGYMDGLPQRTIMGIAQDSKGYLWLTTWNGLCKFDGYGFTPYKPSFGEDGYAFDDRCDQVHIDGMDRVWLVSPNQLVCMFDPSVEKFTTIYDSQGRPFRTDRVYIKDSTVWLAGIGEQAIRIDGDINNRTDFVSSSGVLPSTFISLVRYDQTGREWILTDQGVTVFPADEEAPYMLNEIRKLHYDFLSAGESRDRLLFGTREGIVVSFDKSGYRHLVADTICNSAIIDFHHIDENSFYVLTKGDGFFIYDAYSGVKRHCCVKNLPGLISDNLEVCFMDSGRNLWISSDILGVFRFDYSSGRIRRFTPLSPKEADIDFPPPCVFLEDRENRLWVHPKGGGISYYDEETGDLVPFFTRDTPNWVNNAMLHTAFVDEQNNLWIATRNDGLDKVTRTDRFFHTEYNMPGDEVFIGELVRSLYEDKEQNLWMGSREGHIRIVNREGKFLGHLDIHGNISSGPPFLMRAYAIKEDSRGRIWIAGRDIGVAVLRPSGAGKFSIERFVHNPSDPFSIGSDRIYDFAEDRYGRMWVATYGGGVNLYEEATGRFIHSGNLLGKYPGSADQVRSISMDTYGNILAGTTRGLVAFTPPHDNNYEQLDFRIYTRDVNNRNSISGNNIISVYNSSAGHTYICTYGGGLCVVARYGGDGFPAEFSPIEASNGMNNEVVLSVVEDAGGDLWVATEDYIFKHVPADATTEVLSDVIRLMNRQYFAEATALRRRSGEIVFGTTEGILRFNPADLAVQDYVPYLAISGLSVADSNINYGETADGLDGVRLRHKENFLTIGFKTVDMVNPDQIRYSYFMEGFDRSWSTPSSNREATYTNLPPGKYLFRVRSTDNKGKWLEKDRTLNITIVPSFWQRKSTVVLLFLIGCVLAVIMLRALILYFRMQDRMRLEEEQIEIKARFFTDISHEIRTPLTMIVTPIENMLDSEEATTGQRQQLSLVLKNTRKMLTMVNQVLDFRKINKRNLEVESTPIGEFIGLICRDFDELQMSAGKKVRLLFEDRSDSANIWVDRESIEKLLGNLLSNAAKNTPAGKNIYVTVESVQGRALITVRDEGNGIPGEMQNKLFRRFGSYNTDRNNPSTGIGLSIVKEVVDKHGGSIEVETSEGVGTTFLIMLPAGKEHFEKMTDVVVKASGSPLIVTSRIINDLNEEPARQDSESGRHKDSILVAEDDEDLRGFIRDILSPEYNVIEAANGIEAYGEAVRHIPDFILSDIMMPGYDGRELLDKLRGSSETSHIPFIFLTAKTATDDMLEGIMSGADDYLTKPFNVKILKAKIRNILNRRKQLLNAMYKEDAPVVVDSGEQASPANVYTDSDSEFLKSVEAEILARIDNNELTIDELVATTRLSRTVFVKKIKGLTGMVPVEYIRHTRLRHAAGLLRSGRYMVKEVSYMVGISDVKYFSMHFRKMYGMSPGEYKTAAAQEQ